MERFGTRFKVRCEGEFREWEQNRVSAQNWNGKRNDIAGNTIIPYLFVYLFIYVFIYLFIYLFIFIEINSKRQLNPAFCVHNTA